VSIDLEAVETNIVIFGVADAPALAAQLADDVELMAIGPSRMRAVTHLDVDRGQIEQALEAITAALR
jgi:threonine aldolase